VKLLGSFAYPLLFAALFPRVALSDRLYLYAAALTAVAVLIGATLCESAPFTYSGNLMWQVHMCCCVWFLATFLGHARVLSAASGRLGTRDVLALACLSGHVVNGMAYLVRTLTTRTFM
jgi:hypothetical protein